MTNIRKCEFFERLKLFMDLKGINQKQLSQATGIAQSTITDWKKKGTTPGGNNLSKLATYFGTTADSLLSGKTARARSNEIIHSAIAEGEQYHTETEVDLALHKRLAEEQAAFYQQRLEESENERNKLLGTLLDIQEQISGVLGGSASTKKAGKKTPAESFEAEREWRERRRKDER